MASGSQEFNRRISDITHDIQALGFQDTHGDIEEEDYYLWWRGNRRRVFDSVLIQTFELLIWNKFVYVNCLTKAGFLMLNKFAAILAECAETLAQNKQTNKRVKKTIARRFKCLKCLIAAKKKSKTPLTFVFSVHIFIWLKKIKLNFLPVPVN